MPLLVSCPQCKQQLKIADTAAGQNVKCPGCATVFKAAVAPPAPPPPPLEPVAPVEPAGQDSLDVVPAAPSRSMQPKKKKSRALLYGCLAGVFVVLLCGGTVTFGVYRLYTKGKQAWNEAWTAATTQPTAHRQTNPPKRSEVEATKPAKNDPPPAIQKLPEKVPDPAVIEAEIKAAGAGVKLVKLDLAPAGLELLIDVPEGATAEKSFNEVEIKKGDRFVLKIAKGASELAEKVGKDRENKVYLHSEHVYFIEKNLVGSPRCTFGLNVSVGYRDYYIENHAFDVNKADCLLMIKCARTLALKKPLPADPVAALEALKVNIEKDEAGKVTGVNLADFNISNKAAILLEQLPQLQWLALNASINDEGLGHLAGQTHLKRLSIPGTRATDAGLKHLAGMTELEELDLTAPEIKGTGLMHLAGLSKLKKLYLDGPKIHDDGLVFLKELHSLQRLTLSLPSITGSGLAHIKNLPNLTSLYLTKGDSLSDAGLSHLDGPAGLESLTINFAKISGHGLTNVKNLNKLRYLHLYGCPQLSDAALEHVGKAVHLDDLLLTQTGVSDAGLAHLKGLTELQFLNLDKTKVSDAGLVHLKGLMELQFLYLENTKVSDAGLVHLKGLSKLKTVALDHTKVTDKGVEELKKALPQATISHGSK